MSTTRFSEETGITYGEEAGGWTHYDNNDGHKRAVGAKYCTKAALLADHENYLIRAGWMKGTVMKALFVVIIKDRHADVDAEAFDNPEDAIAYAKRMVNMMCRHKEDIEEELNEAMIRGGWIYYCRYSCESDCVYAMKKVLNPELPKIEGN